MLAGAISKMTYFFVKYGAIPDSAELPAINSPSIPPMIAPAIKNNNQTKKLFVLPPRNPFPSNALQHVRFSYKQYIIRRATERVLAATRTCSVIFYTIAAINSKEKGPEISPDLGASSKKQLSASIGKHEDQINGQVDHPNTINLLLTTDPMSIGASMPPGGPNQKKNSHGLNPA